MGVTVETILCSECGSEVYEYQEICHNCDQELPEPKEDTDES